MKKYIHTLQRALFAFAVLGITAIPVIADFTPTSPAFPHGLGIVRQTGGCSASTDNKCYNGLSFPSFNNYTDSTIGGVSHVGITDERRFLVAANLGPNGTNTANYANSTSVNVGDIILTRAYIHNNATKGLESGNATNVKIGMTGFTNAGSGYFYSTAGTSISLNQFTSAENATPASVSDDTVITSANGSPIKLMFYDTTGAIQSTVNPKTINQANFFSGGANIGTVAGCSETSFYVYVYMRVISGETPKYDLKINKYVGKDQSQVDAKTYTGANPISLNVGDTVYYRIDYQNLSTSTATPVGTKIYDDYDETKLDITWLPSTCSNDGTKITCNALDLAPNQSTYLYYTAKIKAGVAANTIVQNAAEIKPTTDEDINQANDTTYAQVKVLSASYDLKIDKYVGATQAEADTKAYTGTNAKTLKAGDFAYYRIDYQNLSTSTATPVGTKVYDDYDQAKLDIHWLPQECSHDGNKITCNAYDLSPGQIHTFYYIAKIKTSVTANTVIPNNAEVKPLTDADTNDANDHTVAQVKIIESAVCGDGAKTYPATTTAYPAGTVFCAKGTAVPTTPAFPNLGQTVTWTCQSTSGGINATCSATRENSTQYDLKIDKYVGATQAEADASKKEIVAQPGQTITYKLLYQNLSTSLATPVNTRIYDDYDETKLNITWLPSGCTNDGTKITCVAYDLKPTQSHIFYYTAQVKSTVASGATIDNTAEIKPLTDNDTNQANDTSSARVTVNAPVSGECGDAAKTYLASDTQYPPSSIFCNKGTAEPSTPNFPLPGQTVSWICKGISGGADKTCSANRPSSPIDVSILKSVTPTQTTAGSTVTYTLKYQNLTAGTTATGTVIKDFFDNKNLDATTFQFQPPTGVTCTVTQDPDPLVAIIQGKFIQCTIGNLAASDGEKTITYTAKVKSTTANGTSINNIAKIAATNEDTTKLNNNSATAIVTVGTAQTPTPTPTPTTTPLDVTILKSVTPTQTTAGSTVTYTLKYQNLTSGTTATGTVIKDFLDNSNLDLSTLQINAPTGVTCALVEDPDPLVAIYQGKFIQCTIGSLAASDGQKTITYTAKVKSTAANGTNINNVAKIAAMNEDATKLNNNSATAIVTIGTAQTPTPTTTPLDVSILKSVTPTQTTAGSTVTYTLKYQNLTAGTTATGTVIKDFFDNKNLDATTFQFQPPTGVTCAVTQDPDHLVAIYQGKFIQCTIGSLAASDGQKTITYTAKVKSTAANGTNINNVAKIAATNEDQTKLANNTATATVTITNGPTPTPTPATPTCGTAAGSYTSTTESYPSGSTFCSVGTVSPSSPSFPAQGSSASWTCTSGTQTVSCSANRSSSGGGGSSGGGSSGGGSSRGGGGGGGCNTTSTIDLNITKYVKTSTGDYVLANSRDAAALINENKPNTLTYKVVVNNTGDASAYEVVVSDTFSSESGMTQSNVKTISGATYADGKFKMVQPVGANGKQEFTYTATVKGSSSSIGKNTAKIEGFSRSYTCPKISSEKGVGRTSVAYVKAGGIINPKEGGYQLLKSVDKQVVKAGDIVVYTLTLKNTGDIDMKDVVLSDRFPAEFLEPTEEFTSFLKNDRMLQFKQKFLPARAEMTQVVKMKVRENVPKGTEIKNTLTATSLNIPMNDTADAMVTVGESTVAKPTCPAGYSWNASTNKCVKKWIKATPKSGPEAPLLALGISLLGLAIFMRRRTLAQYISSKF